MAIGYRIRQLWQAVRAGPLTPAQLDEVGQTLTLAEVELFARMPVNDQWHAYRVYGMLRDSGQADDVLLAAALLHDVGKTQARLSVWDRCLAVLGEHVAPRRVSHWGEGDARGWKRAFVVRRQHAAWGAALARDCGARPEVIDLIRRHQDTIPVENDHDNKRLLLLQWADGRN